MKTKQIEIEGISLTLLARCNGLETNEETSQELTFEITEQEEAKFEQADQTGLDLWTEAVKFLCSHLKSNLHFLLREAFSLSEKESFVDEKGTNPGKRFPILELGAGLAVPSLFLSKVSSATENIVSDVDCIALNLAQLNAEMNNISKAHFKTISVDWTDFEVNSLSFIPKFIIGSDLLYSSNSVYPIVDFLQKYIPKGGISFYSNQIFHFNIISNICYLLNDYLKFYNSII